MIMLCVEIKRVLDSKIIGSRIQKKHRRPPISQTFHKPQISFSVCHSLEVDDWSLELVIVRSGDVELHPGPDYSFNDDISGSNESGTSSRVTGTRVTSYNVRGLGDEKKLRHLINHCYQNLGGTNRDDIFCFQESFIENPGKVPFLWRGNFHLTPGLGNSLGCLTLLSSHLNIIENRNLGNRAHALVIQKIGESQASYIVVNLYAPNQNNEDKIEFFENVFDVARELELKYNCD